MRKQHANSQDRIEVEPAPQGIYIMKFQNQDGMSAFVVAHPKETERS